jgi:glycosyltransferase involved in cell wall biosynthesis
MKNLLAVSYLFPPLLSPESLLLLGRVRELARLGWKITALTIDPRATLDLIDPRLEESLPPTLKTVHTGQALIPFYAMPLAAKVVLKSLTLLGMPEMQFPWFFFARRPPRPLLDEGGFTAIYSHASHHVSNLVGLAIKRRTGLPWVANFSDPWLDNPYFKFTPWQRPLIRALEKAIIREADAVIFVTSQTADAVMGKYPKEWRKRVHVIPHGFEAGVLKGLDPAPPPRPRLRLVYTGSFYRGRRTPEGLFRGLQLLQRQRHLDRELEVRLLGPQVPPYQALARSLGLDGVVACLGPAPFAESLREAAAADVLLVIDAASDGPSLFLPSKLVDYIPFRKPILGLTPEAGASADVLRQLHCPIAAPDDPQAIAREVETLLDLHQAGRLEVSPAYDAAARQYDIRKTTKVLDGILEEVSRKN